MIQQGVGPKGKYLGLNKPLDSLLLTIGTGLEILPFSSKLVSVTSGRRAPDDSASVHPLRHNAPQHLQSELQFLDLLAKSLAASSEVQDSIFASLLQLVRLEALRGAGPLLIAACLEEIYLLEARIEIQSPYFNSQPSLTHRLRELDDCSMQIASHLPTHGIKVHLTRQVLGKLKVLYQSHGGFGASDELQLELLKRPRSLCASKILKACSCLLEAFFNPLLCVSYWIAFDLIALFVATLLHPTCKFQSLTNGFVNLALTGTTPDVLSVGWFVNTIAFVNIMFLAVFTTSLFRWVTRD